jgi:hypothetical protein
VANWANFWPVRRSSEALGQATRSETRRGHLSRCLLSSPHTRTPRAAATPLDSPPPFGCARQPLFPSMETLCSPSRRRCCIVHTFSEVSEHAPANTRITSTEFVEAPPRQPWCSAMGPTWQRLQAPSSRASPSHTELLHCPSRACFPSSPCQRASPSRAGKGRAKERLAPSLDRASSCPALLGGPR